MITAVILAAGRAVRMGAPKLLLAIGGKTLLVRVITAARASRCEDVLVVLGEQAEEVGREAHAAGARTILNPRYREGMGTSLAAGIGALPPECEAAVVLLGDQPCLDAAAINAIIDAYKTTGKPIVASRYGSVLGAPTLIARALFGEAAGLTGDVGGRPLIRRDPERVAEVDLGSGMASWDVDTPEDLERLRQAVEGKQSPGGSPPAGHK